MQSLEERIHFYKLALSIFDGTKQVIIEDTFNTYDASTLGFCAIYHYVVGLTPRNIEESLPELTKYKPNTFYNWDGEVTNDSSDFWFKPHDTEGRQRRVLILKEILKSLESNTTEDRFKMYPIWKFWKRF